ncbi:MAG: hemin receptor [Burkholderiales bacterium]|nr:hemin receptor [Anaerolineae bacterium]
MPTTITDKQRQLVTLSFARLVPISNEAAAIFYNRLWDIAPETRSLFHTTDMTQQGMKIMQTLGIAVRALHDLDTVSPMLHDLGKRHMSYGVTRDQYELVKSALLWMIEQCLKKDFTPDTRAAWIAAYDLITGIVTSAYDSPQ